MGRHVCLKEWCNWNEISISIDDNLCNGFRSEVAVFHSDDMKNMTAIGECRCPSTMAELIVKAEKVALQKKGTVKPFDTRILTGNESLGDND